MSFADLKRKSQNNFSFLQKELEKTSSGKNVDDRFWKPEVDASGNGYAVIRFLPAPDGESIPWAKLYSHAFQGIGGWYIENSLTTLGEKDPVGEVNRRLWNSGDDADKETARKQKRKLSYYSNILVVKDPKHPENEGKVFLYKYGKKIHDKILAAMQPEFQDEEPINVFDFWEGANFKLKIRKVDGYWNYDKSEFDSPTAIASNDEAIEEIWNKQYALKPFLAPENFKSYDELKSKLDKVLSGVRNTGTAEDVAIPPAPSIAKPDVVAETVSAPTPVVEEDEDSDETLSYFSKLAEEDE